MPNKNFHTSIYLSTYDNFTEADVRESLYNLLRSNASMLDAGLIVVTED